MASSLNDGVSTDAVPTEKRDTLNAVPKNYREQHRVDSNMSNAENTSSEETERTLLTNFLKHEDNANDHMSFADFLLTNDEPMDISGVEDKDETTPKCIVLENTSSEETERTLLTNFLKHEDNANDHMSFAGELVEPMDISVVDNDDKIHRFLLELTATHGLKWTTFLADLGFSSKVLLRLPQEKKDDHFYRYLEYWLETVTRLRQNPVSYLYRALIKSQHKDLVDELKLKFPSGTIGSLSDQEFAEVERHLLQVNIPKQTREPTGFDINEELMRVEKEIWNNITDHELREIKAYLHSKKRDKFGKKVLEEIKTCVDLMRKLHETCLVHEDDFEFLKSILNFVKREDLIQKITALEARIGISKKDNNSSDMRRESVSPLRRRSTLKLTIRIKQKQKLVPMFSRSTRIIEQNIAAKTQDLQKIDERAMELKSKSESCRQKMEDCAKQKMQIEIQIKNLRSEADVLQCSEKTLGSEFISIQKDKEDLKKIHKQQATELDRIRNTLKKENELLVKHKEELEIMKRELIIVERDDPGPVIEKPERDDPGPVIEKPERDDPGPVIEKPERDDPGPVIEKPERDDPGPVIEKPAILVMTAVENKKDLESFKFDASQAVTQSVKLGNIHNIVVENNITEEFLRTTDNQIMTAKLIFILVSDVFVKRCWPDVSKMKNLTSALVDKQPLVVPVNIVGCINFPMGLKSAHCLAFHRRDSYYKDALKKLLRQFME
ncbi:unnamed protein product [Mytilus coruscus]|uniref:Death domain-containing protein n=1 Tax=Mytilus coruscus TaxID=42192 RepID=A0A6J8DH96_MYTCO|nr:unnamed protein product [Mytilus coruscus]